MGVTFQAKCSPNICKVLRLDMTNIDDFTAQFREILSKAQAVECSGLSNKQSRSRHFGLVLNSGFTSSNDFRHLQLATDNLGQRQLKAPKSPVYAVYFMFLAISQ